MRTIDRTETGKLIRDSIKLAEKKQNKVALNIGCHPGTIQKMCIGCCMEGVERFYRLADELGVYPEDLIVWEEDEWTVK